jgi:4-aminobutyrate aminotransferase
VEIEEMTMEREKAIPTIKVSPPGPNALKWAQFHKRYSAHSTYFYDFIWDRSKPAIGPFCTDVDGNIIMDFISHVASSPLGYNHPNLVEVAEKIAAIDPDRYAGTDFIGAFGADPIDSPIPTPSHLHHKLMEISQQFGFDTAFLSNSGAEAVENAIKICYDYRRNVGYGFCFYGAFHGRTLGALSLNRSKKIQRDWYPQIPKIVEFPFCRCQEGCDCGWKIYSIRRKGVISRLSQTLDPDIGIIDPEEVAFIIVEPILGEGGYDIANPEFMREIADIAHREGIPLIIDEIQTGLGRTGRWWGIEHFGVIPDIITSAKALRVGATIGKSTFFPREERRISSTWGEGNAISSAVGYKVIETIQEEELLKNAEEMGNYLLSGLRQLQSRFPVIYDVRGLGLMDAISVETDELRNRVIRGAFQRGLLVVSCGFESIRFLPPLNVTQREIDIALNILEDVFSEVMT